MRSVHTCMERGMTTREELQIQLDSMNLAIQTTDSIIFLNYNITRFVNTVEVRQTQQDGDTGGGVGS